jgi:predicted ATP-grasp superfamily ATP-dependent carboligase
MSARGYDAVMRIFVYEYLSSGALAGQAAAESLRAEGWAMLSALAHDLRQCPGVQTVMLLDPQLSAPGEVSHAATVEDEKIAFRKLASSAEHTLVIAPETGGILEERCRWVGEVGGRLLGPGPEAVRLTADKLALASHLEHQRVPTPPARVADRTGACPFAFPVVVKPRDGAGSLATTLLTSPECWNPPTGVPDPDEWRENSIVQPFVPGKPASVGLLVGPAGTHSLLPAAQCLSVDGNLRYLGGSAPLPAHEASRVRRLAERAVTEVPGLRGFVGVDVVLGEDPDGRGDSVIEINPRLTTSYVGLREVARFNLAAALLTVAEGGTPPAFEWARRPVHWRADGTIVRG